MSPRRPAEGTAPGEPTAEEYLGLAMAWAGAVLEFTQTDAGWAAFDRWQRTQPAEHRLTRRQLKGAEAVLAVQSLKNLGVPPGEIRDVIQGGGTP